MKKIFLTAVALLTMATTQVFWMYGINTDWIDFLTHGNRFRARLEQLGFTPGNDTIKGTFGFDTPENYFGGIIKTKICKKVNKKIFLFSLSSISSRIVLKISPYNF